MEFCDADSTLEIIEGTKMPTPLATNSSVVGRILADVVTEHDSVASSREAREPSCCVSCLLDCAPSVFLQTVAVVGTHSR